MGIADVRKTTLTVEEIFHEGGPRREQPLRIGLIAAVVENPNAGRYEEDIYPLTAELRGLGRDLAGRLLDAMGGDPARIEAYGKGTIVGTAGELEYGALWHEAGGWSLREALGGPKAIVPSNKCVAAMGGRLHIPLGHVNAAYVRSHFLTTELTIHDAPRPNEIVYALAVATGGRIHARAGGLQAKDISVGDGQR
jgi:hypothetical protein